MSRLFEIKITRQFICILLFMFMASSYAIDPGIQLVRTTGGHLPTAGTWDIGTGCDHRDGNVTQPE